VAAPQARQNRNPSLLLSLSFFRLFPSGSLRYSVHATAPPRPDRESTEDDTMKKRLTALRTNWANKQQGGMGYVLLWLLGVPIPVLILISLLRGCN